MMMTFSSKGKHIWHSTQRVITSLQQIQRIVCQYSRTVEMAQRINFNLSAPNIAWYIPNRPTASNKLFFFIQGSRYSAWYHRQTRRQECHSAAVSPDTASMEPPTVGCCESRYSQHGTSHHWLLWVQIQPAWNLPPLAAVSPDTASMEPPTIGCCESRYSQHGTSHHWLLWVQIQPAWNLPPLAAVQNARRYLSGWEPLSHSASIELNAIDWEPLGHFDSLLAVVKLVADMTIPTPKQWEDWSVLSFNARCKCWLICSIHCLFRLPPRLLYTSLFYSLSVSLTTETIVYQYNSETKQQSALFQGEREIDRSRSPSKQMIGLFFALPDVECGLCPVSRE